MQIVTKDGSVDRGEMQNSGDYAQWAEGDASRYCPVCSKTLVQRKCKLLCPECGYYMSCSDYY